MNLVRMIEDQLSGDTLGKLSSAIGADPEATGAATRAAVPTILSGLVSQFSGSDGANRLSNILGGIDSSSASNFANMLGGDSSSLLSKGSGLLGSLFGDGMINTVAGVIGRYSGLNPNAARALLGYLMPLVLGKVASQWRSEGGTTGALSNLLASQKRNIADAMPAGFSLDGIPGMSGLTNAAQSATHATRRGAAVAERAAPSMLSWLLPAAVVLLGGFLLWNMLKPKPAEGPAVAESTPAGEKVVAMRPTVPDLPDMPTAAQLTDELNGTFKAMGETFASIKDATSAEAAAPKLEELSKKIDTLKMMIAKCPKRAALRCRRRWTSRSSRSKRKPRKRWPSPASARKSRPSSTRL
jgi:hypothetical protein